jgi:hypothetical protein
MQANAPLRSERMDTALTDLGGEPSTSERISGRPHPVRMGQRVQGGWPKMSDDGSVGFGAELDVTDDGSQILAMGPPHDAAQIK